MSPIDLEPGRARADHQILRLLKAQVKLLQVVAILQALILFVGLLILLYWLWK
jgi:heme A synthase